ncbi:MAG: hypothetical protein A2902_00525 [Elusimicrobia bacterium RIFCSPLOWO2_01_FULL_64_13]|nr:MAG: hypothetical protein A2902_00525 [Elusimicrobia bacterium RIFCSPLOWO2_01_FULL_64_13]
MRGSSILGGALKRRSLGSVPEGLHTRPILARIKKSLFDILSPRMEGASFLDLFAGSGSVGLEALSRGAGKVVFVDRDARCARWIEKSLAGIVRSLPPGGIGAARVVRADVLSGLGWLNEEFDLIFSGAPYVDESKKPLRFIGDVLNLIDGRGLLAKGGWFIAQHHFREPADPPPGWEVFRRERYGESWLTFFRHV